MSIEKLSSGNYRITQMVDGERYRITIDHKPGKKEAEELIAEFIKKRLNYDNGKLTFKEAFESYLESKSDVLSPSTIKSYHGDIKQLSDSFMERPIDDITQIIIQREINRITARVSPKTVKNVHGIVSAILKMFRPDFTLHTTLPQAKPPELIVPEKSHIAVIMNEVKGTEYYVPFLLGICGMRRSEVMAVSGDDVDGNQLTIHRAQVSSMDGLVVKDTGKTVTSSRKIYIPDEAAAYIKEKGYAYNGHPNNLVRELHRVQDAHGIPRFRFHDLRAYYASYAHMLGIPDRLIQEAGGWKTDYTMKKIYRRTMQEEYQESQEMYLKKISEIMR